MSVPFRRKQFTFTQPDGTELEVVGSGDQHGAHFETLDGFTVMENPATGYYEYARADDVTGELEPAGLRPGVVSPASVGLRAAARPPRAAVRTTVHERPGLPPGRERWRTRRERHRATNRAIAASPGIAPAPPKRTTVGDYTGLCLLIEFPDVKGTIPREEVDAFCNTAGYSGFGNNGSVYDYFLEVSGGKLRYRNLVAPYYKAKKPRAYYIDEKVEQPIRTRELIKEALAHLKKSKFDFSRLTSDSEGFVYALNVFYAGPVKNKWAKGLWPHSYYLASPVELVAGRLANDYQITNMGQELTLGTFCHENGHMICDFPDLYDYGYESNGAGVYCLMCGGANVDPKNPTHVGAYLKHLAGWTGTLTMLTPGLQASAHSGKNEFFAFRRNSSEYFILENRQPNGRDKALPDSGIAVWHIDELGDNSNEQMSPTHHYECALIQADNRLDLEHGTNDGDVGDLFHGGHSADFSDATSPNAKWWDQQSSGLRISGITASGPTMQFRVDNFVA